MLTFLHAADLHLGAPFRGVRKDVPRAVDQDLQECTYRAYQGLVDEAARRRVAFALFAGDLYNAEDGNLRARLEFARGIQRLHEEGIPSYVVRGNHDPLTGPDSVTLPSTCHVFPTRTTQPVEVRANGDGVALVAGRSYRRKAETENLAAQYPTCNASGVCRIGLLHGNIGGQPEHASYAPASLDDLRRTGYRYWALGHVHRHMRLSAGDPWVVYPGALQGLSPREVRPHGCVFVSVDAGGDVADAQFHAADAVRWFDESLEIAGAQTVDDLLTEADRMLDRLSAQADGRGAVVRLRLAGRGPLHAQVQKEPEPILAELRARRTGSQPICWPESVTAATQPELDLEALAASPDCRGFLWRLARSVAADPARLAEAGERLAPLYEKRGKTWLEGTPPDEVLRDLLSQAAVGAIDLLEAEDAR